MAKKLQAVVKLQLPAGKATPGPPVGSSLGPHGINKKAAGIESASAKPNRDKVAKITKAQVEEIAKLKMADLNAASLETAMSMVMGTARSMGVTVEG